MFDLISALAGGAVDCTKQSIAEAPDSVRRHNLKMNENSEESLKKLGEKVKKLVTAVEQERRVPWQRLNICKRGCAPKPPQLQPRFCFFCELGDYVVAISNQNAL